MAEDIGDPRKNKSIFVSHHPSNSEGVLSPLELKDVLGRLIHEEHEFKEIKLNVVRKLTADMTERGRKLGTHLESIHSYVVKDCSNTEESQDNCLSEELADEIRKKTTSVDSEIKQLENQMGQLQRTLVKGKARRESIRHRISASSPAGGHKAPSMSSSCSSMPEDEELTAEDYKSKIEMLESEKLELFEDKKDLNDEIKFLKYQLQYRLEVQSLQNERNGDAETHIKLENENKTLREENTKLKERFSTIKKRLEEGGQLEEILLSMTDVPDTTDSSALIESELDRLHTERKILLSTIMRMQSCEKDEDEEVSFADFGVQCNLMKMENMEEKEVTPLVAKLTKENKVLKKHITDMQNEIDEREEESKTLDEENYKLTEEKRTLEDTVNKLRTQINETLDTTLDEIEHLHSFNEDLEVKFKKAEAMNKELSQLFIDLQNRTCKSLENLLDQVENKLTVEEILEYLDKEIGNVIEENCSITVKSGILKNTEDKIEKKEFSSNLLEEVKTCKELLESQRSHIRNIQLEKRDIEEGYTKMKRELLLLKSNKQRARENSKELQFLKKRRVKSLNDGTLGEIETKGVVVDKESLQREIKRLGAVKTQLENNVQKLKKEKATLEDEKVCLLGSLYHQLERNESLEIQIEELTVALEQWEAKADLENEVFEGQDLEKSETVKFEDDYKSTNQHTLDSVVDATNEDKESIDLPRGHQESVKTSTTEDHLQGRAGTSSNESLTSEYTEDTSNIRPNSPLVCIVSTVAEESLQELKQKIHVLVEQLENVQESVFELETERDKRQEDLEESKKNEKELRNVIIQLKRENGLYLDKVTKSNELSETLQIRLGEAKAANDEAMESLEEANKEKIVCKRHSEVLNKRLQEVVKQRDDFQNEVKKYKQNVKEIQELIHQINNVYLNSDEEDASEDSEKNKDYYQKEYTAGLKTALQKANNLKSKHEEKCLEFDILKNKLRALNTEKEALQKSVREIDDKKKQMKGFITKLTEEKERVTEQLDEMKQQKINLADALENVYQSKEKLQGKFGEALCKQEKQKKSLIEALDEVKALKESLCRVVNEHETMKESLLAANREVERLKCEQQVNNKTKPEVIPEEAADKGTHFKPDQSNKEKLTISKDNPREDMAKAEEFQSDEDKNANNNNEDFMQVIARLKQSLALLTKVKGEFETRVKYLLRWKEIAGKDTEYIQEEIPQETTMKITEEIPKEVPEKSTKEVPEKITEEIPKEISEKVMKEVPENLTEEVPKKIKEDTSEKIPKGMREKITKEVPEKIPEKIPQKITEEIQDKDLQVMPYGKSREVLRSGEIRNKLVQEENKDWLFLELSWKELILEIDNQVAQLEAILEQVTSHLQYLTNKLPLQDNMGSEEKDLVKDKEYRMELFEGISAEKENLEKEVDSARNDNFELVQALEKMRKDSEKIKCQLRRAINCAKSDLDKPQQQDKEWRGDSSPEEICELIDRLEMMIEIKNDVLNSNKLEKAELLKLTKELQENNKSLEEKLAEVVANRKTFVSSEKELEKSIKETNALEKQVENLSNEGATLRGEADERVQRLIELEEKMIVTMEKKLELAEYAKSLKSKKESLEKRCEQLTVEAESLKISRDQLLVGTKEMDEKLRREINMLKAYKEKSVKEIEELHKELKDEKQDFEAIKIEIDSMQRKNKALKKDREKFLLKEAELLAKNLELERSVSKASEEIQESSDKCKEMNRLLNILFTLFDKEIMGKESTSPESSNCMNFIKTKVYEMQGWIVKANEELQVHRNESKFLNSFVRQVDVKIDIIGKEVRDELYPAGKKSSGPEDGCKVPQIKENCDIVKCKLDLLIEKVKEIFRRNANLKTELEKVTVDNERISKELISKSSLLQTMTNSFEQHLQERNILAQNADDEVIKREEEQEKASEPHGGKVEGIQVEVFCTNCKKLEKDYSLLKSKFISMNKESSELVEKCHHLKEQLILLKQQQEDIEEDEISDKNILSMDLCSEVVVTPQNVNKYQSEPHSELDVGEGTEEQTEILQKQLNILMQEKAKLEIRLAQLENKESVKDHLENINISKEGNHIDLKAMENKIKEILHQHQRETVELKREISQLESELNDSKQKKEEMEILIKSLSSELGKVKSIDIQKFDDSDDRVELHKTLVERSNSVKDLNEKLGVSKNFMQKILDENKELKERFVISEKEGQEMINKIEILKVEIDLKRTALIQTKEQAVTIESKNHELEEELTSLKDQLKARGNLLAALEKDKETFKVNLREVQNEVASLKKKNCELTDFLESGEQRKLETENLIKKLKQSCDEMTTKFENATTEKKTNEGLLQNEKTKTDELKAKVEKLEEENEGLKTIYERCKENVENLTAEHRKDKSRREREIGSIKQENAILLAEEGRAHRECDSLRQQLNEERKRNEHLEEDLKGLNKKGEYLKKSLLEESEESLQTAKELKENKKEGRRLSTLTSDLKDKVVNLEAIIAAVKKENNDFKEELDRLKQRNGDLRVRLDEANEDKEELETIIDDLREKRQKLYNEIDKALAERDDLEDELMDTKQLMTEKVESLVKDLLKTSEKLEHQGNVEIFLRKELEERKHANVAISEKYNLEKMKIEREMTDMKGINTQQETEKEDDIGKVNEVECEIKKSQKHIESTCESQTVDVVIPEKSVVQKDVYKTEKQDEILDVKKQISNYMIENMRLRAQLEESDCKLITLQDDLYRISKEGVHREVKMENLQRECEALRQTIKNYKEEQEDIKRVIQASNNVQSDLRKRLRNAITDKEKYEKEFKKLMLEKGAIKKVKVTATEIPPVSQIEVRLDREYVAKAESLENARKEMIILQSQVRDLQTQSESSRQFVEQVVTEVSNELKRARYLLGLLVDSDEEMNGVRNNKQMDVDSSKSAQVDDLRKGIKDVRKIVDTLEGNITKTKELGILHTRREKENLMKILSDVREERNVLTDKLLYLQRKLSEILEERQALEDISADTRKKLTALQECLSIEREKKINISSEHSEMQAKLQGVDSNEQVLQSKISSLEKECEELLERNRHLEMKVDDLKFRSEKEEPKEDLIHVTTEVPIECTSNIKELKGKERLTEDKNAKMTLESLRKDFTTTSAICDKLENRNKIMEEEKKLMVEEMCAYKKKLETKNQDLLAEIKRKDQHLKNMQDENNKLLVTRKTLETQVLHLDKEVFLLKDHVVCSEAEKQRIEDVNRQQQNEIQELYLHRSGRDDMAREKLENLFYENTKLKEQKKMLVARLQSLERDIKYQLLTIRDLENEKDKMYFQQKNTESEKQRSESRINYLVELLDKNEEKSGKEIETLTEMVERLTGERDKICQENPQFDKMRKEMSRLEEENFEKNGIIDSMKEEIITLMKENNLLRRACENLKESRRVSKGFDSSLPRTSPRTRDISDSKQSSFSSFDRMSLSNSQHSFSDESGYTKPQPPPKPQLSSNVERQVTCDVDSTSVCSQECYCSPILSVVNLRPLDTQQPTDFRPSYCPKCSTRDKTKVVISEHYV